MAKHVNPGTSDTTTDLPAILAPYRQRVAPQPPKRPSQRMSAYERQLLAYTVLGWMLVALAVLGVVFMCAVLYHVLPGLLGRH